MPSLSMLNYSNQCYEKLHFHRSQDSGWRLPHERFEGRPLFFFIIWFVRLLALRLASGNNEDDYGEADRM
jgi:hypothetical protein